MSRYIFLFFIVSACSGGYTPGAFSTSAVFGGEQFRGRRLQHGCLDIVLRAVNSIEHDPVLEISLGNRCVEALRVDLSKLEIRGIFPGGERRELVLFDPRGEINNALLGGRAVAQEQIEIEGGLGSQQLCISVQDIIEVNSSTISQETCINVEVLQS